MRPLIFLFCLFPLSAFADDVPLTADVTAVTIYPEGATVRRQALFSVPEGQHSLIVENLPARLDPATLRVRADGVRMDAITVRQDAVPPRDVPKPDTVRAAEAEVKRLEALIVEGTDTVQAIGLRAEAAQAQIGFLTQIGTSEGLAAAGGDSLRELTQMIGDEGLAARQAAHDALIEQRKARESVSALQDELKIARQALAALVPESEDRLLVTVQIEAEKAVQGNLQIEYLADANWRPVNDYYLTSTDTPRLEIKRGAFVEQHTGENWEGVQLVLSTARPSEQFTPSVLRPDLRRAVDKEIIERRLKSVSAPSARMMDQAGEIMPEPMIVAEAAVLPSGLNVEYAYPTPVTLASGAEAVRLSLSPLSLDAKLVAQAVPLRDQTAFLMAEFTNDSGEVLLPSFASAFYLDQAYVGSQETGLVAAGDEAALSFGPMDGIRLARATKDRSAGDRGILSRSSDLREDAVITVSNLTGRDWPVRVLDRVPYSEQDVLEISWSASPKPNAQDYEDQRGILAWEFDLAPGAVQSIALNTQIVWPEGQMLR